MELAIRSAPQCELEISTEETNLQQEGINSRPKEGEFWLEHPG